MFVDVVARCFRVLWICVGVLRDATVLGASKGIRQYLDIKPDRSGACGRERKMLVATDQKALRPTRGVIGIKSELPRPLQQRGQHCPGFDACKRGSHAVVDALSECEMTAWGPAGEVDDVGVVELFGIPVRRSEQQQCR